MCELLVLSSTHQCFFILWTTDGLERLGKREEGKGKEARNCEKENGGRTTEGERESQREREKEEEKGGTNGDSDWKREWQRDAEIERMRE